MANLRAWLSLNSNISKVFEFLAKLIKTSDIFERELALLVALQGESIWKG